MNRTVALILTVGVIAVLAIAGPAAAGDGSSTMYSEENSYTVAPGDELEIVVLVSDHGSLAGTGLEEVSLVAEYDPDQLTATDIEAAGWFESADEDVTAETDSEIDRDEGVATLTQTREPVGDGTTATEPFATITFSVDEDAAGNTTVALGNSSVTLAGGHAQPLFVQPANDGPNGPQVQIKADQSSAVDSVSTRGLTIGTALISLLLAVVISARHKKA